MMKVTVQEDWRRFDVKIGAKKVGRIEGSNGYYGAYVWCEKDRNWEKDVGSYETVRRAMQAIFQSLGYGKFGRGFKVKFAEVQ